jgi:hypothetical protein
MVPGQTVQFSVVARLSDGSTRDVTRESQWTVSAKVCSSCTVFEVLSVNATGGVTAQAEGDGLVIASFGASLTDQKDVIAVPAGTCRLVGVVRESQSPFYPVPEAQVEVCDGMPTEFTVTTGHDGEFRL